MEGNTSTGSMMPSYDMMDPQGSTQMYHPQQPHVDVPQGSMPMHHPQQHYMRMPHPQQTRLEQCSGQMHHPQQPHGGPQHNQQQPNQSHHDHSSMLNPPIGDFFALPSGSMHEKEQQPACYMMDYNKNDDGKTTASDEDDWSFNNEDIGHHESEKEVKACSWNRMKWTDEMVLLLLTVMSYLREDVEGSSALKRKLANVHKKGKWKLVSKVMTERGHKILPQQCEDKFNDLNKRYRRLVDILGKGTSWKVVETPTLLDELTHISIKAKDDVRKILSSKHLFYKQMCSYHNGSREHLPTDPAMELSLRMHLIGKDEHGSKRTAQDICENDQGTDSDEREDDTEENKTMQEDINRPCLQGKMKQVMEHEHASSKFCSVSLDCNKRPPQHSTFVDKDQAFSGMSAEVQAQRESIRSRSLDLEVQRLQIEEQMLKLEMQRFKWQQFSKKKERELDQMRLENETKKLKNERLALDLKHKELAIGLKLNEIASSRGKHEF